MGGLGSVCFFSQGVYGHSKGAGCEIRLRVWGGPLGAERGLWGGWGLCDFLHRAWVREGYGRLV